MAANIEIISHWYHLIDGLQSSSLEYYKSLEEGITRRKIPDARVSRVEFSEGGLFSGKREYLRVERKEFTFDICAALFGNGFFVSWWLFTQPGCLGALAQVPILGWPLRRFIRPVTYWYLDSALMFQESVHVAVIEVVDGLTTAKGIRALSELDRKPILREFFKR